MSGHARHGLHGSVGTARCAVVCACASVPVCQWAAISCLQRCQRRLLLVETVLHACRSAERFQLTTFQPQPPYLTQAAICHVVGGAAVVGPNSLPRAYPRLQVTELSGARQASRAGASSRARRLQRACLNVSLGLPRIKLVAHLTIIGVAVVHSWDIQRGSLADRRAC